MDKHSAAGEPPVRLCNYTDVYKNASIVEDIGFMAATAPPEQIERFRIAVGDTLLTKDSENADDIGVPAYVEYEAEDLICGYHLSIVRPNPGTVEPKFLYWALSASPTTGQWAVLASGVTRVGIRAGDLSKATLALPPFEEQRAIADYLDRETARIDTLVEEQQRLIEMLRERRAAVLSAAFDIGPSTEATKVGRLLAARPSYGVLVPRYVDEADGVPFVRVGDLLNLTPERPILAIAPKQSDEYSRTKIVGGEVLLGVVGKMGQAALAPQWLAGANVARAVAVLRCEDPAVAPLLCAWLGSNHFLHQAELATSGDSIQPTLGMKDLARFNINLPTRPNAASDLASRLAKIDALIDESEGFIELSKERRAALITAAVTGQIDVREMA
ncbi:restriction endonuclease subunit S [Saccharopolyspora gloriosae]|uniref:restriction endonuclease subunit S n=1 Tax=Saccharopolyspora gloriosae TaxID=455344 RepID=UPI001FB72AA8|nr:restriction endonuclease subunit S [Saccharopolyspora gloriosae]